MTQIVSTRSYESRDYDIDANFLVNKLCNFNCTYCFYRDDVEHPGVELMTAKIVSDFLDRTGLRWHLHISGGEPFVRTGFVELCELVTKKHLISINTNLVSNKISQFIRVVHPETVDVINSAVHIMERERRKKLEIYISNFLLLKGAGFRIRALYVLTPECFGRYMRDRKFFAERDIHLEPKFLSGYLDGRFYPRDYTDEQRQNFERWSMDSEKILFAQAERSRFDHIIKGHQFERLSLHGKPDYRKSNCSAGRLFVSIAEDGSIFRCGVKNKIGDIKTGELRLYSDDRLCDNTFCNYFCYAFSDATAPGREMDVQHRWMTPIQFLKRVIPLSVKNDIRRTAKKLNVNL